MVPYIKENLKMAQKKDTEFINGQIILSIKVIGKIMNLMDTENMLGMMAENI